MGTVKSYPRGVPIILIEGKLYPRKHQPSESVSDKVKSLVRATGTRFSFLITTYCFGQQSFYFLLRLSRFV